MQLRQHQASPCSAAAGAQQTVDGIPPTLNKCTIRPDKAKRQCAVKYPVKLCTGCNSWFMPAAAGSTAPFNASSGLAQHYKWSCCVTCAHNAEWAQKREGQRRQFFRQQSYKLNIFRTLNMNVWRASFGFECTKNLCHSALCVQVQGSLIDQSSVVLFDKFEMRLIFGPFLCACQGHCTVIARS